MNKIRVVEWVLDVRCGRGFRNYLIKLRRKLRIREGRIRLGLYRESGVALELEFCFLVLVGIFRWFFIGWVVYFFVYF